MQNKVNYLRIIVTEQCNISCPYCHHEGCFGNNNTIEQQKLLLLLKAFYYAGIRKFKFLGGEPTLYKDLPRIIYEIRSLGEEIDISIVSNGIFKYDFIKECFKNGLNRINISVHVWKESNLVRFKMNDSQLVIIKNNLKKLLHEKKLGKINYVYINEKNNEELFDIIKWVDYNKTVLDILNILGKNNKDCYNIREIEALIKNEFPINREYIRYNRFSLPSKRLVLKNGGEINLKVFPLNQKKPFNCCFNCDCVEMCTEGIRAIRLTPNGTIKPCLFRNNNLFEVNTFEGLNERILSYIENL